MKLETEEEALAGSNQAQAVRMTVRLLGATLILLSIAWAFDLYQWVGFLPYEEQFLGAMLGIGLVMVYLWLRADRGARGGPVPWYDWILAGIGGAASAYLVVRYPALSSTYTLLPTETVVTGVIMIALIAEGLRRATGNVLFGIFLFFILFSLFGQFVPAPLTGHDIMLGELSTYLTFDTNSLLGTPMRIVTSIVVAFLLMGSLLRYSGGTTFFTDISMALMGGYRGGSAKIAVTASGLFGSVSGSVVSNVVSTGMITIPLMRKGGYSARSAAAIEAVASTGGQLMPPVMGAAAFLMAEFLEVAYSEVVLAALLPALIYYGGLFLQVDLEAAKLNIAPVDSEVIPSARSSFGHGWIFIVPFAALIYTLFNMGWPAELAALSACAVLLVIGVGVGYRGKRMGIRGLWDAIADTGVQMLDILMIGAAAGIIIGSLNLSGLGFSLTLVLVDIGGGNIFMLLLLAAAVCIILGMGMPTVGVYILLATLVAPAMINVGVNPIAAHMYVLYFGMMSMITPPIAIGAFAAATVAKTDPIPTAFSAVRFGWSAFLVPFLFIFSPSLLMQGPVLIVLLTMVTAFGGVWITTIGVVGFYRRPVDGPTRLALAAAGLALMVPSDAFAGAIWTDLVGAAAASLLILRELRGTRVSVTGVGA